MTDRHRLPEPGQESLVRLVGAAASAGVNLIQVRERDLEARQLLVLTRRIVSAVEGSGAAVVVNDRVDVALASGADGVHLRADSMSAARVRALVSDRWLVGRSVHGAGEASAAARTGVDYLIMGTIYPTRSKGEDAASLAGLSGLAETCRSVRVPVLAIGGVTADNLTDIAAAGAAGIAAVGLFADAAGFPLSDANPMSAARDPVVRLHAVVAAIRRAFRRGEAD